MSRTGGWRMRGEMTEKYVGPVVVIVCTVLLLCFSAIAVKEIWPRTTTTSEKAVALLMEDIEESIAKGRGYFYILESYPECPVIKSAIEGELRGVIEKAIADRMDIRVIVPLSHVTQEKAKDFLDKGLSLQLRLSNKISKDRLSFCVSGSYVREEIYRYDDHKKLRKYPYAPRRALRLKETFEELWDTAQSIQLFAKGA